MNNRNKVWILLFLVIIIVSCGKTGQDETKAIADLVVVERVGEIRLINSLDGVRSIIEGLVSDEKNSRVYGIDFRSRRVYVIDVDEQTIRFISPVGSGPSEFRLPIQIALNENHLIVYDNSADRITIMDEHVQVVRETQGTLAHGVWTRGTYSILHSGNLIASIKDPQYVQHLDFESARAVSLLNLETGIMEKVGVFPPGIDQFDSFQKYPLIALDAKKERIYYVFYTWPAVLMIDLNSLESQIMSDYWPDFMRKRTIKVELENPEIQTVEFARKIGVDRTQLVAVEIIDEFFLSIWSNYTHQYYDSRDPSDINYFGVRYDLPEFTNPQEFELPGKVVGSYEGKLLILEDDDPLNFVIGQYLIH